MIRSPSHSVVVALAMAGSFTPADAKAQIPSEVSQSSLRIPAGMVRASGDVQFLTMNDSYFRVTTGVRVVALTQSAAAHSANRLRGLSQVAGAARATVSPEDAAGKKVRVTLANGDRFKAELAQLSATELVVRRRRTDVRYPLDQVMLVETVHHGAKNAAIEGAIAGFVVGYAASCGGGDEGDCWPEVGAMVAGVGAGAGALIGALFDHLNAAKHIIYAAPTQSPSVRLAPFGTAKKAEPALAVRW